MSATQLDPNAIPTHQTPDVEETSASQSRRAKKEKEPSVCWRGLRVIVSFTYEVVAKVALFILLGFAAMLIIPPAAGPLFTYVTATVLTRLVVKILDHFEISCLDNLKDTLFDFTNRYPVQIISLVSSVALSLLWPLGGCIIAAGGGCVNGVKIGAEAALATQEINRRENNDAQTALERIANA